MSESNDTRFALVRDGDGHWYVIPADKMAEWEVWAASDDEDEPAYSNRLSGSPSLLTFTNPVIDR